MSKKKKAEGKPREELPKRVDAGARPDRAKRQEYDAAQREKKRAHKAPPPEAAGDASEE